MLVGSYQQYKKLPAESIAQLLWNIHSDARLFFSTPILPDGTLPESQLRFANGWLGSGSIKLIEGCHVDRLLGLPRAPAAALPGPPASAVADWMTAAPPEHYNNKVHPLLAAAVLLARTKWATVKIMDLINATTPPVPYNNVRVGAAGSCLDMIILRKCVNPQSSTFSHTACGIIPDARAREIVRNLQPGIDAFVNS